MDLYILKFYVFCLKSESVDKKLKAINFLNSYFENVNLQYFFY